MDSMVEELQDEVYRLSCELESINEFGDPRDAIEEYCKGCDNYYKPVNCLTCNLVSWKG